VQSQFLVGRAVEDVFGDRRERQVVGVGRVDLQFEAERGGVVVEGPVVERVGDPLALLADPPVELRRAGQRAPDQCDVVGHCTEIEQ
jgi:hypothetical protein